MNTPSGITKELKYSDNNFFTPPKYEVYIPDAKAVVLPVPWLLFTGDKSCNFSLAAILELPT